MQRLKNAAFALACRVFPSDIQDTIVLAGAPRSGTTWLLELFRTLPSYKALNEPLMYEEARLQNGFSWRTHIAPDEHHSQKRAYLRKILTGGLDNVPAWHFEADARPLQLVEHLTRRKLVVKFCRAGRMLQWSCKQFDTRGTVLIIRHPCAVVASMRKHGGWNEIDPEGWLQQASKNGLIPDVIRDKYAPTLERVNTRAEILTATWCLETVYEVLSYRRAFFSP